MMVLASVYISVSENLPVSFNIKPIEQWLLFNLFWPFLIFISNILLQVEAQHHNIPRNNISSQRLEAVPLADTITLRVEPLHADHMKVRGGRFSRTIILRFITNLGYPVIYVFYSLIYWSYFTFTAN